MQLPPLPLTYTRSLSDSPSVKLGFQYELPACGLYSTVPARALLLFFVKFNLETSVHLCCVFFFLPMDVVHSRSLPRTSLRVRMHASLTALSLADHAEVHLLLAGPHVQLALAVVGAAVAAAHGLVGVHALRRAHTLGALFIADCPKGAVGTGII